MELTSATGDCRRDRLSHLGEDRRSEGWGLGGGDEIELAGWSGAAKRSGKLPSLAGGRARTEPETSGRTRLRVPGCRCRQEAAQARSGLVGGGNEEGGWMGDGLGAGVFCRRRDRPSCRRQRRQPLCSGNKGPIRLVSLPSLLRRESNKYDAIFAPQEISGLESAGWNQRA
jgi:hypothetical protein